MRRDFLFALLFMLCSAPAFAWNALGHKAVAEIAWRELTPEQRQSIVGTLRRHPRFDKDFAGQMTDDVLQADKATQDHWIFQHAGTWPDIARDIKDDDRMVWDWPQWHYVNFPLDVSPARHDRLHLGPTFNRSDEYPTTIAAKDYNVIQAIKHNQHLLESRAGPDIKAIAYCWLIHLVGDLHQPLHSTSLVSFDQFPAGDRSGNDIPLARGRNLHSLWDNLLGRRYYMRDVDRAFLALTDVRHGSTWGTTRARAERDVRKWVDESAELCKWIVYSPEVIDAVRNTPRGQRVAPIELPDLYMRTAGQYARERVIVAGLRLAVLLGAPADRSARWLNTQSNVRHNQSCRWYTATTGRFCVAVEGDPCGHCGG